MVSDFPPTVSSNYEDLLVEYLEVYVPKEHEQLDGKDLLDGCLKSECSASDSDSGRGSCDSHTLLMDKCGEAKEDERQTGQERMGMGSQRHQKDWEEEALVYAHKDMVSPDISSGRVKTWPSVFSPFPQYSPTLLEKQSTFEHYLSDSLFRPGSTPSYLTQPGHTTKDALGPSYWEFCSSNKQPHLLHPQMQACRQLQAHSDINISSIGCKQASGGPPSAALLSTENVAVHRVGQEDVMLLQPVESGSCHTEDCPQMPQGEDYSRVKGVDRDNMLLLQRQGIKEDIHSSGYQEINGVKEDCHTSPIMTNTKKPVASIRPTVPTQDEVVLPANGYVDTATICTLPIY